MQGHRFWVRTSTILELAAGRLVALVRACLVQTGCKRESSESSGHFCDVGAQRLATGDPDMDALLLQLLDPPAGKVRKSHRHAYALAARPHTGVSMLQPSFPVPNGAAKCHDQPNATCYPRGFCGWLSVIGVQSAVPRHWGGPHHRDHCVFVAV